MVVERFKLQPYFRAFVSSEHVGNAGKPAPDIYIETARQLQRLPQECVVIEDAAHGVTAAQRAGMKCIGIRNGYNDTQDISHADLIIHDYSELSLDTIQKLSS